MERRILVILLCCVSRAYAKVVSGSARLTGEVTEHELAKFAYSTGAGKFEAKLWIDKSASYGDERELAVYAFLDTDWAEVQRLPTCSQKIKLARWSEKVQFNNQEFKCQRVLNNHIRTHVWYFMLSDCSLEKYLHKVPTVSYRLSLTLDGGGQLPLDELGMRPLVYANLFLSAALFCCLVLSARRRRSCNDLATEVHAATGFLGLAVGADVLSSFLQLRHVDVYARDGVGSYFCDALSCQLEALSDSVVAWLLVCIASGWTIATSDDRSPLVAALRQPLSDARAIAGALCVLFVHLALAQWSRLYEDDFSTFHDLEHLPGRIVVLFRLALGMLFLAVAAASLARSGDNLRHFIRLWTFAGVCWYLTVPILTLVAAVSPAYSRHRIVAGGGTLVQTASLASLVALFTLNSKSNAFLKNSTVGSASADLSRTVEKKKPALKIAGMKVRVD